MPTNPIPPDALRPVTTRPGTDADHDCLWRIFSEVLADGRYYALDASTTREEALAYWTRNDGPWYVAERDGRVVGACMMHPNQPGHGSHVANAAFVVDAAARGMHVGRVLVERAVDAAVAAVYRSMQFNLVVATNLAAIRLYREMGFAIIGREPEAFQMPDGSYANALIFHRRLAGHHAAPAPAATAS
jgi:ribosomal protein S18 acetylase RimI-like enzyme